MANPWAGYVGGNQDPLMVPQEFPGLGRVSGALMSSFGQIAGPPLQVAASWLRYQAGYNDLGEIRRWHDLLNYNCVFPGNGPGGQPVRVSVQQAIQLFNQEAWTLAAGNPAVERGIRNNLKVALAYNGVDSDSDTWRKVIDLSCEAAPIQSILRAYYRSQGRNAFGPAVDDRELNYQLQKASLRRPQDRDLITRPYANWTATQIFDLLWQGWIKQDEAIRLLRAAGYTNVDDLDYVRYLQNQFPPASTLYHWAQRFLWDDVIADRYGLDVGFDRSPIAQFFVGAAGLGKSTVELPGQPAGNTRWTQLIWRAGRAMPSFGEAIQMQRRLRPAGPVDGVSVVPGVPSWTEANTRDILKIGGFPQPIIDRLIGLVNEPLSIRIINETLLEALKHPQVAADAQAVAGPGVDWVKGAYLDHGYADAVAQMAADAIRAKANDAYFAEKIELQKTIRKDQRTLALDAYKTGTIDANVAYNAIVNEQCDGPMADALILLADSEVDLTFKKGVIAQVKEAFMGGKLTAEQAVAQLNTLGIAQQRQAAYLTQWGWERGDRQRMLSTSEILAALKAGLLAPDVAAVRLVNLGWTQPDAAIEIAMVQHELDAAQARVATSEAAKEIAAQQRAQREATVAAAAKTRAETAAAKAKDRADKLAARVPLEAAKAANEYGAAALIDLDAYNAAIAKGETNKANAEIDKAIAAYEKLLLSQLALAQQSPGAADEIKPIGQVAIPPASTGAGTGSPSTGAPPNPGPTTTPGSGTGAPPAVG